MTAERVAEEYGRQWDRRPRPQNQSRHTLGGRAVKKFAAGSARVDVTLEGYYQFGEIGMGGADPKNMDIEAYAFHIDGGVTLPVPMAPRLSAEFNTASGNKRRRQMEKLRSIVSHQPHSLRVHGPHVLEEHEPFAFGLQLRPNKDSHFEVTGHLFSRQETTDGVVSCRSSSLGLPNGRHLDRCWGRNRRGLYPFLHPREPRGLANRRRGFPAW